MTPPHTLLMTWATAPLPWMTVGMPGYFGVAPVALSDIAGGVQVREEALDPELR